MSAKDQTGLRMLVQYAYCKRLGYLENAQKEFEHNAEVIEGRHLHRRVDRQSGAEKMKEGERVHARSVELSDPALGFSARLDLLELDGKAATPVEYKRGRAPEIEEGAWPDHRIHVCAQGLLLRANGYESERGVVYYVGSKKRVGVEFDDRLVSQTLETMDEMKSTMERDTAPPPLVDSPKCPRCSLVEICMPDEVNLLSGAVGRDSVRRMYPVRSDARPVHVQDQGARVGKRGDCLHISVKGGNGQTVRLIDVSSLTVRGNVQVTTQALRELLARGVPVCYTSYGGRFVGMATGGWHRHAQLRVAQHRAHADEGARMAIARQIVHGKVRNCATMLRRNGRDCSDAVDKMGALAERALGARRYDELLGVEGLAARAYFEKFGTMIRADVGFDFEGRNRRPPRDPVNSVLSYMYSILSSQATAAVGRVGLDPYVGFLHMPKYGKPALALDVIEEFRPLVADSACITALNNGEVGPSDFTETPFGVYMTDGGRIAVTRAFERRMDTSVNHPVLGYPASYRRIVETQARLLSRHLLGEVPSYPAFRTR